MRKRLCLGSLKKRDQSKGLSVPGRIILNGITRKEGWSVDWIYLAQDKDR
jgi:hypothetical protein